MIFSLFYPIILGLGPLPSNTVLFPLILLVCIFRSEVLIYPIQIYLIANMLVVNLFQFHGVDQNLELIVAVVSISPLHQILSNYSLGLRRNIYYVYILIVGAIYVYAGVHFGNRDFAQEIIGIGTYNAHGFFALLLLAFIREINLRDTLTLACFLFIVGGRTNLLLGIIAIGLFGVKERILLITSLLLMFSIILWEYQTDLLEYVSNFNQDFASKGVGMGPRGLLYSCMYEKTSLYDYILGVDFKSFFESCFDISVGDKVESSVITMISHLGLGSIVLLLYLIYHWKISGHLWLFILLMIRAISGEFFFFGVFDYFIFLPVLYNTKAYKLCW